MNNQFDSEIDLIKFLKKLFKERKIIIYFLLIFFCVGVVISLTKPIIYSSSTTFIPHNLENNNSSFSGVASLVGINLGSGFNGSDIPPSMYPQIEKSAKFKRMLLNSIIDIKQNITLDTFIKDYYDIENESINSNTGIYVSKTEESTFEIISSIIKIGVDSNDGFVTISSEMPNAEYSAVIVNNAKTILQKIIIENRIESAKQTLNFSLEQLKEKKKEFNEIQSNLAYFKDTNLNLVNSSVINQQDKLEAEFAIINAVVTDLSKQVEQAKLQVSKETPVFSTLKEATIPNVRISPKRKQIVLVYMIIGLILSAAYILFKDLVIKFIKEIIS